MPLLHCPCLLTRRSTFSDITAAIAGAAARGLTDGSGAALTTRWLVVEVKDEPGVLREPASRERIVHEKAKFAHRRRLGLRTGLTESDRFTRAYRRRSQSW